MKKTRRRYDRDFKISVLDELDAGKPLAQVTREYGIHPSGLPPARLSSLAVALSGQDFDVHGLLTQSLWPNSEEYLSWLEQRRE